MASETEESSEADAPVKPARSENASKKKASTKKRASEKTPSKPSSAKNVSENTGSEPTDSGEAPPALVSKKQKKSKNRVEANLAPPLEVAEAASDDEASVAEAPVDEAAQDVLPGEGTEEGRRLREAYRAFEAGDHLAVQKLTAALADAKDSDVRVYAAGLARRVKTDVFQVGVIAVCFGVLVWIVYTWIL